MNSSPPQHAPTTTWLVKPKLPAKTPQIAGLIRPQPHYYTHGRGRHRERIEAGADVEVFELRIYVCGWDIAIIEAEVGAGDADGRDLLQNTWTHTARSSRTIPWLCTRRSLVTILLSSLDGTDRDSTRMECATSLLTDFGHRNRRVEELLAGRIRGSQL
eukprot:GFKZ01014012.1.p1 GENE.GFKZ01014012.1~~GFKZ01014012.1.p1  ORF type:complete len:167 (+),score=6.29 GFKZ01014012.1:26-502(+)